MTEETKSLLKSKTVWGVIVSLAALGLNASGFSLGEAEQSALVDGVLKLVEVAGALFAVYGRAVATKKIG